MSIWIIELNRGECNKWVPHWAEVFLNPKAAAKYLKAEWPNQPNYARIVEYVRKEDAK